MKAFELSIKGWFLRLLFMMGLVLLAGFSGQWWLATLALPIFLSAMMGMAIKK